MKSIVRKLLITGVLAYGAAAWAAEAPRVIETAVTTIPGPLQPSQVPYVDQSVLLGYNPYCTVNSPPPWYEPVEAGAFQIKGGKRKLKRTIVNQGTQLLTGELPILQIRPLNLGSRHAAYWPQPDSKNPAAVVLGTLNLGVVQPDGKPLWFHALPGIVTTFWPGYTDHEIPPRPREAASE